MLAMADVPPILRVALTAWAIVPVPDRAVLTVSELLFVNVTPVTVTLAIVNGLPVRL